MAKTAEFKIIINGIQESIDGIQSINKQLDALEKRLDTISSKNITVSASVGGGGKAALNEEAKMLQKIDELHQKVAASEKEQYQELLHAKEELKEYQTIAKSLAAQDNLKSGVNNLNTMQGLKAQLHDLKAAMQTVDFNGDQFRQWATEANEITAKLKELEALTGTFSRNVGNYAEGAYEGMKKFNLEIGGVTKEFESAKQALRELKSEMQTLEFKKDQGIISPEEAERLKELIPTVEHLESVVKDAGKPMDALLDTMQSITAIASMSEGLSAFFGLDNTAIEESIQKLVALQNIMQGLEQIQQQMNTGEGIGKWLSKGNEAIDKMVASLTGAKSAATGTTTALKGTAVAETTVGTAAKTASVGVRILSASLKAIGIGFVIAGITALIEGISYLTNAIKGWVKGNANLIDSEKMMQSEIEQANRKLDERRLMLEKDYLRGAITEEQYYKESLKATTQAITEQIEELRRLNEERLNSSTNKRMQGVGANAGKDISSTWGLNIEANDIDELTEAWKKYFKAIENGKDVISDNNGNWFQAVWVTLDDTKDELVNIGQVAIGEFINRYEHAMETMKTDTKKGEAEIRELQKLMNSNDMMNNVLTHLDQYIPDKEVIAKLQNIINKIKEIPTAIDGNQTREQLLRSEQLRIDAMKDGAAKRQAQRNLDMKKELSDTTLTEEDKANIRKKYENRKLSEEKKAGKKAEDNTKKVEQNIAKARVDAMKQGLTKTLAQLQLERNRRIEEAKKTGYMVAEQIELINNEFYKKEFDARVKYHTDLINEEKRYAKELEDLHRNTWQMEMNNSQLMHERELQDRIRNVIKNIGEGGENDKINTLTYEYDLMIKYTNTLISRYIELKESIKQADTVLKMFNEDSNAQTINGKTKSAWEEQIKNFERELKTVEAEAKKIIPNIDEFISEKTIVSDIQKAISARLQIRRDYYKQLEKYSDDYYKKEKTRITEEIETETQALIDAEKERHEALAKMFDDTDLIPNKYLKQFKELKEASKDLLKGQSETDIAWYLGGKYMPKFNEWIDSMEKDVKAGKANIDDYIQYTSSELYQSYIKVKNDYDNFMESYKKASKDQKAQMSKELEEWTDKMNVAYYKYFTAIEEEFTEHENRMKVIQNNSDEQLKKANQESLENQRKNIISYYSNMATEYERAMAGIRNNMNDMHTNDWGLINYTYEKKKLQDLQTANTIVMSKIAKDKEELVQKLKENKISFEDFDAAIDRLNTMEVQVQDIGGQLAQEMKRLPEELLRGIDQWIQQIGQAATSIIQSLADITDATIQNELDALDEQTKALEEALDKQRELTQKYADDVNSIEDELATARSDRRQNLIDQLNAQMEAQRNSLAQEKKMEKEKEALDKKRDDLEFQQKMNQWNASKLTAKINAALAISSAAVNTWPIPAIPLMALATAVGAAQIAAVAAAKPKRYASGGLLEGPDHKHHGIPVGNTGIEVEGKEYVIRKESSIPNLDLLSYINRKKRKLNLDDFIDFYSNNSIKGSIERVRPKYANGGQLPTLRNDIDINNRLITAIDDFANKPTYVEVVDIINKADNVRQVRALSGLKQN